MITLTHLRQTLKRVLSLSLAVIAISTTVLLSFPTHATALNKANPAVSEQAQQQLVSSASVGNDDPIEDQNKQNTNQAQQQLGASEEGKSPVGQAQESAAKAENVEEDVQEPAGSLIDSLKDLFQGLL